MSDNNIKSEIINFYNDPLYQELNAYYSKKTIFNILKIERNENRHSAFLAWLLDTKGSHGLGDEPLKKFMRLLYLDSEANRYDCCFLIGNYLIENLEVSTEKYVELDKENGRIDVYLEIDYRYDANDKSTKRLCVIIENKMFTREHGKQTALYRDWALKTFTKENIIGVFLAPNIIEKCKGDSDDFKFLKIDYQDMLDYVLEPLLLFDMPQEARAIIKDYVINLEQPLEDEPSKKSNNNKANTQDANKDTILAVSKKKKNLFLQLYNRFSPLLDSALVANGLMRGKEDKLRIVYGKDRVLLDDGLKQQLDIFWKSNVILLRMIMNAALLDRGDDEKHKKAVNDLLGLKESNRNKTKYIVKNKYGNLMNDLDKDKKAKPAYMSLASYYVFKAWLQDKDNENATLKDIRNAFPVEECAPHYNDTFQYLFYKESDIKQAKRNGKTDRTYFIAELDEDNAKTKIAHKYLTWDFYMDGKHNLKVKNEENGKDENVLNIKYWTDDEFKKLMGYSKQYGISVEPA